MCGGGHDGLLGTGERNWRAAGERHQRGGERGAGLMQPGLDRADRDGKLGGYLTVGEALQVEQEDGVPLAVGQLSHRGPDRGRKLGEFRALIGAGVLGCPVRCLVEDGGRPFRPQLAYPAAGHVQRDPAEPGAEPARRAEPVQAHHCRDGGLLRGIAGQVRRAKHPGRECHGRGPVPGHQRGKGVLVTAQGGLDQPRVAGRTVVHTS